MKYALLIYATPGAAEGVRPADDGVIDSWLDYTAALKESGSLLAAEQLAHVETAGRSSRRRVIPMASRNASSWLTTSRAPS